MKRVLLLFALALPALAQFGNATKLQSVPICAPLTRTNAYILTYNSSSGCFDAQANGGASGSVTTSGLATNTIPKATGASALGDSLVTDNGTVVSVGGQLSIKGNPLIMEVPNSSTGTTTNKLAKIVNTGGVLQAQIITTSAADQTSVIGVVISGAGTTGTALIMIAGTGSAYFDGATTAGHIAIPSATSAGALHDTGSASSPAVGEVVATVGATNACGSPPCLIAGNLFMTPDLVSQGSNGNGGGGGNNGAKGAVNTGTINQIAYYAAGGNTVSGETQIPVAALPTATRVKSWTVIVGDPGAASTVLANDNDSPVSVDNDIGIDVTITAVACWADAGSPTITPILTAGTGTSILTGALTCGTAAWAAGTLNGTPTLHTFSAGATCSSTPCSADVNITAAGGVAKYLVVKITGTY